MPTIGLFFAACGSCALNQYQERNMDKLMARTKDRPLPSGKLASGTALLISLSLILIGLSVLIFETGLKAFGLAAFAVFWYNGVYTYLKKKTAFAAIPGALIGGIPPVLGWVAGGRDVLDPRIGAVALFLLIWQIPHFWLLLLDQGTDYKKTGLPSLARIFTPEQIKRIVFIWMLSIAVSSLLIPLFGMVKFYPSLLFLLGGICWVVRSAVCFLKSRSERPALRIAFMNLNLYAFGVISLLSFDKLINFS